MTQLHREWRNKFVGQSFVRRTPFCRTRSAHRGTLRAMPNSSLERLLLLDGKLWVDIPAKLPQLSPVFRNIHEYREDFAALLVEEARESVKSGFEQSAGNDESIFSSIVTLIFDFSFWVSYECNCHQNISRC